MTKEWTQMAGKLVKTHISYSGRWYKSNSKVSFYIRHSNKSEEL